MTESATARMLDMLRASVRIICEFPNVSKSICAGDGLKVVFVDGRRNEICIMLRDGVDAVYACDAAAIDCRAVALDEFDVEIADVLICATPCARDAYAGSYTVTYAVHGSNRIDDIAKICVCIRVYELVIFPAVMVLRALCGATSGRFKPNTVPLPICTVANWIDHAAINAAGTRLAISQLDQDCVHIFRLPDLVLLHTYRVVHSPVGVCFTSLDTLLIADFNHACVRHMTESGHVLATFCPPSRPYCVAAHDDVIAVGCRGAVSMFALSALLSTGEGSVTEAVIGKISMPNIDVSAICFASADKILVAMLDADVCLYTTAGVLLKSLVRTPSFSIAVCADSTLLVADRRCDKIRVFTEAGDALPEAALATRHCFHDTNFATLVCSSTAIYILQCDSFTTEKYRALSIHILK